jgi:8-oxo-dGTP pyrophosphatase MutT (NUDIX family)
MKQIDQLELAQIRRGLLKPAELTYDVPDLYNDIDCQQAAVLMPLLRKDDEWHLLFIRRAIHELDHHSGQVAFAGGKYEKHDDDLHSTALREAHEEIGLLAEHVKILGELGLHYSVSRFRITPVVAYMPWPYNLTLDQREVARTFTIPLNWLANPQNHRIKQRNLAGSNSISVIYFEPYDGEVLWGASARMTLSLIKSLELMKD